jgi:hypothetical protein
MSEFELNEDRDEFEVLEDFVYNCGNNNNTNNNSKRNQIRIRQLS